MEQCSSVQENDSLLLETDLAPTGESEAEHIMGPVLTAPPQETVVNRLWAGFSVDPKLLAAMLAC